MTEHPAKYSKTVLEAIKDVLDTYPLLPGPILDPMAGVGLVHQLRWQGLTTWGVELEREWAEDGLGLTLVADATALPFRAQSFAAVVCSPPYANRMADHHEAKERCKACQLVRPGEPTISTGACSECHGLGSVPDANYWCSNCGGTGTCPKCLGAAVRTYKRNTYRHILGRQLTSGSAAGMQWGDDYRKTMLGVVRNIKRVLMPGGLVLWNVSNHIRKGEEIQVAEWFETVFHDLRFARVEKRPITTRRNRFGANRDLRTTCEWLYVFRLPNETSG